MTNGTVYTCSRLLITPVLKNKIMTKDSGATLILLHQQNFDVRHICICIKLA